MIKYKIATAEDVDRITDLVLNAYEDYPSLELMLSCFDSDAKKQRVEKEMHLSNTRTFVAQGNCHIGIDDDGSVVIAVFLVPPKTPEPTLLDHIKSGALKFVLKNGIKFSTDSLKIQSMISAPIKASGDDYWYISQIATKRDMSGHGLPLKTFTECIDPYVASKGGGKIKLVTFKNSDLDFYRSRNFDEFEPMQISYYNQTLPGSICIKTIAPDADYIRKQAKTKAKTSV